MKKPLCERVLNFYEKKGPLAWGQGNFQGINGDGSTCYCLGGVANHVTKLSVNPEACEKLAIELGFSPSELNPARQKMYAWNDANGRTFRQIMTRLRVAVRRARAK